MLTIIQSSKNRCDSALVAPKVFLHLRIKQDFTIDKQTIFLLDDIPGSICPLDLSRFCTFLYCVFRRVLCLFEAPLYIVSDGLYLSFIVRRKESSKNSKVGHTAFKSWERSNPCSFSRLWLFKMALVAVSMTPFVLFIAMSDYADCNWTASQLINFSPSLLCKNNSTCFGCLWCLWLSLSCFGSIWLDVKIWKNAEKS